MKSSTVNYEKVAEAYGWRVAGDVNGGDDSFILMNPESVVKWSGDKHSCEMKLREEGQGIVHPPVEAGMAWTDIAKSAYKAYAASTGNKNYQGLPMPEFEDLPLAIQTAWEAAVRQADRCTRFSSNPSDELREAMLDEQSWAGWVRP